ncbi:Ankyrin repeat domain-containing protein 1 [Hondaea fermentalgiana]|uniref:Ankyrin repeat domain-containing protein 1 n=1 Tax=Hondaea fermentalgiana TaxID=2315210 RepID=A0A2R5GN98_9STRA|nr:Ankyrin repeat domain-containing protein 1 [Hondaea fermentalgiana]|eukprot:GBG32366.1 Ankyrin repeat domain-containing protein 1 [Hondaea fermentalgiana]
MPRDTDLHKAAYKGNANAVRACIDEDMIDVNEFGAANRTALHRAVASGSTEVVALLLDRGAIVDIQDKSGRTPLHWAAVVDAVQCAEQLGLAGADINKVSNTGSTPLHMAADQGKYNFVAWALQNGADFTLVDNGGMTAYDLAKQNGFKDIAKLLKPGGSSSSSLFFCGCWPF